MNCEDIANLESIDANSVLQILERRFRSHKPYLMCRDVCISVNPLKWLHLYDNATRMRYARTSQTALPAHIYIVAENASRRLKDRKSQTIVITGESGAGKTEVARLSLDYIAFKTTSDRSDGAMAIERTLHTSPILEYMGNAQTVRNGNSSRFGKLLSLVHDSASGKMIGADIQTYLLEKSRAVHGNPEEGTFRIFYAILDDDALRERYGLQAIDAQVFGKETAAAVSSWMHFEDAATAIGIDASIVSVIIDVTVAIMHMLMRDYCSAAVTLGIASDVLTHRLEHRRIRTHNEDIWTEVTPDEMRSRSRALSMALYERLFHQVVVELNRTLKRPTQTADTHSLHVLDIFGFESFDTNHLEQLCINYCNERMQSIFVNDVIVMQRQEYEEEGINCDKIDGFPTPRIVEMCEKTLFPTINEALRLRQSPEALLDAISSRQNSTTVLKVPLVRSRSFTVEHYAGPVSYDIENFIEKNSDELRPEIVEMLSGSSNDIVSGLFKSVQARENSLWTRSVLSTLQEQMQLLSQTIINSDAHYIRCIKPNDRAVAGVFDPDQVELQITSNGIVHACRVMRLGYDHRVPIYRFVQLFPRCTMRRRRRVVTENGGFWGRTIVYMTKAAYSAANEQEAKICIVLAWRNCVARRAMREQVRQRAILTLQRHFRRIVETPRNDYRELSEVERLRLQVRTLRATVERQEAWMFRAIILLKRHASSDERLESFVSSGRPLPTDTSAAVDSVDSGADVGLDNTASTSDTLFQ